MDNFYAFFPLFCSMSYYFTWYILYFILLTDQLELVLISRLPAVLPFPLFLMWPSVRQCLSWLDLCVAARLLTLALAHWGCPCCVCGIAHPSYLSLHHWHRQHPPLLLLQPTHKHSPSYSHPRGRLKEAAKKTRRKQDSKWWKMLPLSLHQSFRFRRSCFYSCQTALHGVIRWLNALSSNLVPQTWWLSWLLLSSCKSQL